MKNCAAKESQMIKKILLFATIVVFYGCSDSGSSNAPSHSGPATLEDLPNCTDSREGELDTLTDNGYVYRCEDGGWEFVSARLDTAATMDDLSNCTSKLDGDSVLVESENAVFRCRDGRWKKVRGLTMNVATADDLPACTSKRDEDSAYVADEHSVYGCYDGKWKKLYALMDTVKTADDMSSCNDKRENDSAFVQEENRIYICMAKKWRLLGDVLATEDDMKNCTENREDMRIYVKDIRKSLICRDGKWFSFKLSNLVEEEDEEDEEPAESSSSEEKWEELPSSSSLKKSSSSVASSSSVKSSSSSVKSSSSSAKSSSSSIKSSSSVASSSSVKSSSSEASSSSANDDSKYDASKNTLTDFRDNQTYKTVTIGTQIWMAENLNYNYNEGSAISYCYGGSAANCSKYGRLYVWSAAMDSAAVFSTAGEGCGYGKTCNPSGTVRGVCPVGWHLPTKAEWGTLLSKVGGVSTAGDALRSITGWIENDGSTDAYGFSVLPAGYFSMGGFDDVGNSGSFWSSTEYIGNYAYDEYFRYDRSYVLESYDYKNMGISVRCLKN